MLEHTLAEFMVHGGVNPFPLPLNNGETMQDPRPPFTALGLHTNSL